MQSPPFRLRYSGRRRRPHSENADDTFLRLTRALRMIIALQLQKA